MSIEDSIQKTLKNLEQVRPKGAETPVDMSQEAHELKISVDEVIGIDPRVKQPESKK